MPATDHGIALPARYRVLRRIATGGMAVVWSAEDTMLGRTVAVKVLLEGLAEDDGARARFLREARAGARLSDHPHVVTVYDLGEHDGRAFMVMEQMAGGSLAARLGTGRRPPQRLALRWLAEAAGALDHAHALDIVHRDVKPANLLLDERNRLAVGDFGIAVVAGEASVTQTGLVMGTASYLAPEQAMGLPATAASDRYALAVVAFELLTGRRPFMADGAAAQARAHVDEPPPPPSNVAPELPPAVDDVMARALAKEPDERPLTASAFVDELAAALGRAEDRTATTAVLERVRPAAAGVAAAGAAAGAAEALDAPTHPGAGWAAAHRDPTPAPAAAAAGRAPAAAPPPAPPGRPGPRKSRWPAVLVATGALALAAGAGAAVLAGDDDGPAAAERTTAAQERAAGTPARTDEPSATPQPAPDEQPAPQATAAPDAAARPAGGTDPVALNDRGFALLRQGRPADAVPVLQRSVEGFRAQGRTSELPYAYALFNLGRALRLSGRPAEAIPYLEERLKFDDQRDVVERELAAAREAAGQGGEQGAEDDGGGKGRGKGKGKGKD